MRRKAPPVEPLDQELICDATGPTPEAVAIGQVITNEWLPLDQIRVAPDVMERVLETLGPLVEVKDVKVRLRAGSIDVRVRLTNAAYRSVRRLSNQRRTTMSVVVADMVNQYMKGIQ